MLKRLFAFMLLLLFVAVCPAQGLMDKLPVDKDVRTGTLDNGARYYVRANKKDPQRASFHIVYNVGALQEDDSQDGLAHFLEHMAFNGSKNFPGNKLIDYLQTIGVQFGRNLNASTAQQFTTYMITDVPLVRETITDSLLLVLHDWAGSITLADEDIDKERGVIREELRTRNTAPFRIMQKNALTGFANTLVAERNVIGDDAQLESFTYDQIRSFYHKWYRPDQQAFIIVGDFDPDQMVSKLKATMADIKEFDVKTPKQPIEVPENAEPKIGIYTDPELTGYEINLTIQSQDIPQKDNDSFLSAKMEVIENLHYVIMSERLDDIMKSGDAPFHSAMTFRYDYTDMFGFPIGGYKGTNGRISYDSGKDIASFEALLTEMYRAQRFGFTQSELDRAKANLQSMAESAMQRSGERGNEEYVQIYESNFLLNEPFVGAEDQYNITSALIAGTTLDELNGVVSTWMGDSGWIINVNVPAKEGEAVVAEEALLASIAKVKASEISAPEDVAFEGKLIEDELEGSKIVKTEDGEYGSIVWTLENGIKVIFKSSNLNPSELSLNGYQVGGTSLLTDYEDQVAANYYSTFMGQFGLGEYSSSDLAKVLSGKDAWVNKQIGTMSQGYNAGCMPKDAEEMFQLLYLSATAPRYDEVVFGVMMDQVNSSYKNSQGHPSYEFQKAVDKTLYSDKGAGSALTQEVIDALSIDGFKRVNDRFFSSSKDMVFTIVGNIEPYDLQFLVEKYIGSLPVDGDSPKVGSNFYNDIKSGEIENIFTSKMETPKVTSFTVYTGDWDYSVKGRIELSMISELLNLRYTKTIREEQGGTYGVGCAMQINSDRGKFAQLMQYDTEDAKIDVLQPLIYKEIQNLVENGALEADLAKVKENYKKNYSEAQNQNSYWKAQLADYYYYGRNDYKDYLKVVDSITSKDIQKAAKAAFTQGNLITLIQKPE